MKNLSSNGQGNISPVDINKEMRESYLQYSMSVIVGRALPDARDGLKPVHSPDPVCHAGSGITPTISPLKNPLGWWEM